MSKILDATCSALGVVTSEGVAIPSAEILSAGTKASTGLVIIDGENAWYFPSSATDISDVITNVVACLNQTITILSGLNSLTGSTLTAAIATLTTLKTTLNTSKDTLK